MAKNPLVAKRASSYAERLRVGIAFMHGEVKEDEDEEDGRASPPPFQPGAQQPPHNPSLSDRSVPMYLISIGLKKKFYIELQQKICIAIQTSKFVCPSIFPH